MRSFEAGVLPGICPVGTGHNREEKGKDGMERETLNVNANVLN
jgi:hypothetical protein